MKAGGSNQCKKEKIKKTQNSKKKLLTIKARRRKIQKRRKKSKIKTAHNEGGDCSNERKNEDTSIWSSNNHCRSSEKKTQLYFQLLDFDKYVDLVLVILGPRPQIDCYCNCFQIFNFDLAP